MKVPQINSFSVFKTDFSSTKELYSYAQKKIINCAKKENKEYLIIANTKTNKILFDWINRYSAAVADTTSGNVRSLWCEDGYIIAYDPSWIFSDLYSS